MIPRSSAAVSATPFSYAFLVSCVSETLSNNIGKNPNHFSTGEGTLAIGGGQGSQCRNSGTYRLGYPPHRGEASSTALPIKNIRNGCNSKGTLGSTISVIRDFGKRISCVLFSSFADCLSAFADCLSVDDWSVFRPLGNLLSLFGRGLQIMVCSF